MQSMTINAAIRKEGRRLYWRNRRLLWMIYAMITLCNLIWNLVVRYLITDPMLVLVTDFLYHLAVIPFMLFGLYQVQLSLWHGEKATFGSVFAFYKPPYQPRKVIAASLYATLAYPLLFLAAIIPIPNPLTQTQALILLAVMLYLAVMVVWIFLRLFLFPFLFIQNADGGVFSLIRRSFRLMKRKVLPLLWFGLTVFLPLILWFVADVLIRHQYRTQSAQAIDIGLLIMVFQAVLYVFILPAIDMPLVGYADRLLQAFADPVPQAAAQDPDANAP